MKKSAVEELRSLLRRRKLDHETCSPEALVLEFNFQKGQSGGWQIDRNGEMKAPAGIGVIFASLSWLSSHNLMDRLPYFRVKGEVTTSGITYMPNAGRQRSQRNASQAPSSLDKSTAAARPPDSQMKLRWCYEVPYAARIRVCSSFNQVALPVLDSVKYRGPKASLRHGRFNLVI